MIPKWIEALRQSQTEDEYRDMLERRIAEQQQIQDRATSWEAAKEALGGKKVLANLLRDLERSDTEDAAHAGYTRNA